LAGSCQFTVGNSYCVEQNWGIPVETPTTTTTTAAPTSTGNGIQTPTPIQDGMTKDCNKFHLVVSGDGCTSIQSKYGITFAQLLAWNPAIGGNCQSIWLNTYVCVGVIGATTTTSSPPTTTTGNGIQTPTPIQDGMTKDCNKFHLVVSGDGCTSIQSQYGITFAQLLAWNPAIGGNCQSIWLNTYVCVGVIGGTTTTSSPPTTTTGNGISTPSPIQDGMVKNCNKFHLVSSGEGCASIGAQYGVSTAQLFAWNPAIGNNCQSLWLNTYLCVGVIGSGTTTTSTTSTTKTGNGIATPTPIRDGMTTDCTGFHFVVSGETCQTISTRYGISFAQFLAWNPYVGSNCAGLWLDTWVCVQAMSGLPTTTTLKTSTTKTGNGVSTLPTGALRVLELCRR
jgi:LysM repeat protein